VDQFLNRPVASLIAAGCIVLLCGAVVIGGLVFAGSLYAYPKSTPFAALLPTAQPVETSAPQVPIEKLTITPSTIQAGPQGKIVYVCQIFKVQERDQICMINADGTGQRRLTTNDNARHFYPSPSPDGQSVLFSSNMNGNFEIYELFFATDQLIRLGGIVGTAPEISPDNRSIAYVRNNGATTETLWVMDRQGLNSHEVYRDGWDPTWSPDGSHILFATTLNGEAQLAIIKPDGTDFRVLTDVRDMRGRSDWSDDGLHLITYLGKPWERELFLLNPDGSDIHQVSRTGGNSQGPSFSPDGQWIAFTAYFDHYRVNNGCEIYIMRIDGSELTRLTDNDYCDWQPRWGP
jgi:Tol biopolymer transport system component